MTVGEAKAIAREWVLEHAPEVPGLHGVFVGGSMNWLPEGGEYTPVSDVDLYHVIEGDPGRAVPQRKLMHKGVLLEVAGFGHEGFVDPDAVAGSWVIAPNLSVPSVIFDPSGDLSRLQRAVAARYAERVWVRRRCEGLQTEVRQLATALRGPGGLDDRVLTLAFAVSHVHQIPLVASLKPPTIRKGCMLFTDGMKARGQANLAELLLELVGSAPMARAAVEVLLGECTAAYDRALGVHGRPTPFDFDLCPAARHLTIDGSQDMIDRGYHREAAAWILFVHWLAKKCLELETPDEYERTWRAPYQRLLDALGIGSLDAIARRADLAEELLALTMAVAETIIEEGPS